MKSAADKPFYIKWNPIIFGSASVTTVLPVPGGPNKTIPLEKSLTLSLAFGVAANWKKYVYKSLSNSSLIISCLTIFIASNMLS